MKTVEQARREQEASIALAHLSRGVFEDRLFTGYVEDILCSESPYHAAEALRHVGDGRLRAELINVVCQKDKTGTCAYEALRRVFDPIQQKRLVTVICQYDRIGNYASLALEHVDEPSLQCRLVDVVCHYDRIGNFAFLALEHVIDPALQESLLRTIKKGGNPVYARLAAERLEKQGAERTP